jgi:hypothetical protein
MQVDRKAAPRLHFAVVLTACATRAPADEPCWNVRQALGSTSRVKLLLPSDANATLTRTRTVLVSTMACEAGQRLASTSRQNSFGDNTK